MISALMLWSLTAFANDAKTHFAEGITLYRRGDHAAAVAQFQRAHELSGHPVALYNLGLAYEALERPVAAVDTMKRVLASPGNLSPERIARAKQTVATLAPRIGELAVRCNIDGATVRIDGIDAATTPTAAPLPVKGGTVLVEVLASGHLPVRREVIVAGGQRKQVDIELVSSDKRLAQLTVMSPIMGAGVYVDGNKVATTPVVSSLALLPGQRHIELRRDGYHSVRQTVMLAEGGSAEITLTPTPDGSDTGVLVLTLRENSCQVRVDSVLNGVDPTRLTLPPGPHDVEVACDGFITQSRQVDVPRDAEHHAPFALDPTPATLADHLMAARGFQIGGWVSIGIGAALVGASVGYLVHHQGKKDDANADADAFNRISASGSGERCDSLSPDFDRSACELEQQTINERQDDLQGREVLGYVGIGLGAAAVTTGVVLLLTGEDPHLYDAPPMEPLAVTPLVTPGGAGLSLLGRF